MRKRLAWMMLMVVCLTSCDQDVQWRDDALIPDARVQPERLLVRLPPKGLASLYTVLATSGIQVERDALLGTVAEQVVQAGPFAQKMTPQAVTVEASAVGLKLAMRFDAPRFLIPVRVQQGVEVVICRWQLSAQQIEVRADLLRQGARLEVSGALDITARQPQVEAFGAACPGFEPDQAMQPPMMDHDQLSAMLLSYVEQALKESLKAFVSIDPAQALGLPTGELFAKPQTLFDARLGELRVLSRVAEATGLRVEEGSVLVGVDAGLLPTPAACAPREDVRPPTRAPVGLLAPSVAHVQAQGADAGIAVDLQFLTRLLQGVAKTGFLCQGLTAPEGATVFPRRLLLLDDIGLSQDAMGEEVSVSVSPGALPELRVDPTSDRLVVDFPSLQLEVYTTVLGLRMRVAQVRTKVELSLNLTGGARGTMRVQVRGVETTGSVIDSEWRLPQSSPSERVRETWVQRLVLLTLGEEFDVPLFFFGQRELDLQGVTLNAQAVNLFVRF